MCLGQIPQGSSCVGQGEEKEGVDRAVTNNSRIKHISVLIGVFYNIRCDMVTTQL